MAASWYRNIRVLWVSLVCAAAPGLGVAPPALAEPTCRPVTWTGDAKLVDQVARALPTGSKEPLVHCRPIRADVRARDELIEVTVAEPNGRTTVRVADNPEHVAAIIDSLRRIDVTAPLLAARSIQRPTQPPVVLESDREPPPTIPTVQLSVGPAVATGSDRGLWRGVRMDGCVRVAPLCFGGLITYTRDAGQFGLSSELDTKRSELGFHLSAAWPVWAGPFLISPSIALGQTVVEVERQTDDELYSFKEPSIRFASGLNIDYPLANQWALRTTLWADVGASGVAKFVDSDTMDPDPEVAGVPRFRAWLALGIAWGQP